MTPPDAPSPRNQALDGLRGVAAMSVALGHCFLIVTGLDLWKTSLRDFPTMALADVGMRLLSALFPSDAAVMVFFVLSGHVLWESFCRRRSSFAMGLPDYICARLYRLYPVIIVSALPLGLVSDATSGELVRNMLLTSTSLNGALWSLQVEIVDSLALYLVWGIVGRRKLALLAVLALSFAATPFFRGEGVVVFLPAFLLGASISLLPLPLRRNILGLAAAIPVLLFANVILGHGGVSRVLEMLAATVIVGSVAAGRLRFLGRSLPHFLGKISYPFYLTHAVGVVAGSKLIVMLPPLPAFGSIVLLAVSSILVTLPIAWALHVLVEASAIVARPRFNGLAMAIVGIRR